MRSTLAFVALLCYAYADDRVIIIGGHPSSTSVYEYRPGSAVKGAQVGTLNEPIDTALGAGMISDTEALIVNTGVGELQGVIETHFLNINDFTLRDGPNRILSDVKRESAAFLVFGVNTVVCGGSGSGGYLTSCEWYVYRVNSGSKNSFYHNSDMDLNVGRMGAAMAGPFKDNGGNEVLLIAGGWGRRLEPGSDQYSLTGTLRTAEIFSGGTWSMTQPMSNSRTWHAAGKLDDSNMIVCGGIQDNFNYLSDCEIYNFESGYWSRGPALTTSRYKFSIVELSGDLFAVSGYGELATSTSSVERLCTTDDEPAWERTDDVLLRNDGINLGNGPTIFGVNN